MARHLEFLPRLTRLRAFEAAAHHRSFAGASRELQVTQAAVSQQVRALEQELGAALFVRLHRRLMLTPEGQRLLASVSSAFGEIAAAAEEVKTGSMRQTLRMGATFAVATFWLVARLPEFRALHPNIDIHLITTDRGFERVSDQVDIGIAYGDGSWPGFESKLLRDCSVFPVCSPAYLADRPPISTVEQLARERLLSIEPDRPGRVDWPVWFEALGVDARLAPVTLKVNSHPLLVQAACEGQGIALGWDLLTDDLISQGRLVRPVSAAVRSRDDFYFVTGRGRGSGAAERFESWLFGVVEKEVRAKPRLDSVSANVA